MINERLIEFLTYRDWDKVGTSDRFIQLKPPVALGFQKDYTLPVPINPDTVDFKRFIENILKITSELYDQNEDDLKNILEYDSLIFSIRVLDKSEKKGTMPFPKFDELVEKVKSILLDTASFVLNKDIEFIRSSSEALKYLNMCNFLQTEKGSFVTKIQLPTKSKLREKGLFDSEAVYSSDVNSKIAEILKFVNDDIFEKEERIIDSNFIEMNSQKLNIKVLSDIEDFYDKTGIENLDFGFNEIKSSSQIYSKNINKFKINRLSKFIENLGDYLFKEVPLRVQGQIISLKSRNPDGTRNLVKISGIFDYEPIQIAANLSSKEYKLAIEAHKEKRYVLIDGIAKKTKTQYKYLKVDSFKII